MKTEKAILITIGDELLIGQTTDTNSAWMARQMDAIGIEVIRHFTIPDRSADIIQTLDIARQQAQLILITGGLGPTNDDVTKATLTEYFGGRLVTHQAVLDHIKVLFNNRKKLMLPANFKQADLPDTARILKNRMGTAAGMWFEDDQCITVSMPGVPYEMKTIVTEELIPALKPYLPAQQILFGYLLFAGIAESDLAKRIEGIEQKMPANIHLAYLPVPGMIKLRLTALVRQSADITGQIDALKKAIIAHAPEYYVTDKDTSLADYLIHYLSGKKLTLATAESCTGGMIGHLLTNIPGASEVYKGGIISYTNEIKQKELGVQADTLEKYTAVSEQTALEMARGALHAIGSDLAISVTGLLGPSGGTEAIPVGTVWIGIAHKESAVAKVLHLRYDRLINKEIAAMNALNHLRLFLKCHNL